MIDHIVAYRGLVGCSLGVMQEAYLPTTMHIVNDQEVTKGLRISAPMYHSEEKEWLDNLPKKKGVHQIFAVLMHERVADAETHSYIGHTGIHGIQWPNATGETGSVLGNTDVWEKGLGTEAKLLLQYHAFRMLGLRKLTSSVKAFNARSLGHLIKTGYRIIGRYTSHEFHDGAYVDEILLECFRESWEPIWETYQTSRMLPKLTPGQRQLVEKETNIPT